MVLILKSHLMQWPSTSGASNASYDSLMPPMVAACSRQIFGSFMEITVFSFCKKHVTKSWCYYILLEAMSIILVFMVIVFFFVCKDCFESIVELTEIVEEQSCKIWASFFCLGELPWMKGSKNVFCFWLNSLY